MRQMRTRVIVGEADDPTVRRDQLAQQAGASPAAPDCRNGPDPIANGCCCSCRTASARRPQLWRPQFRNHGASTTSTQSISVLSKPKKSLTFLRETLNFNATPPASKIEYSPFKNINTLNDTNRLAQSATNTFIAVPLCQCHRQLYQNLLLQEVSPDLVLHGDAYVLANRESASPELQSRAPQPLFLIKNNHLVRISPIPVATQEYKKL